MKKIVKSAVAALMLLPALAHAQAANSKPFSLGVSGGASFPVGDFGKGTNTGYTIAGHVYVLPPSMQNIALRGDVSYDHWGFKGIAGSSLVDGNAHTLAVTGNVMLKVATAASVFHPYLIVGAGGYNTKASASGYTSNGTTNFGIQGGGGFEFALSGFATFVEAKYVNVFAKNNSDGSSNKQQYIPLTFGVRF
ncbi:MAG: porin family protein [Gemmatimonadota bacterium]|nr:porin family protein [Gemmatimonadota bacterium]